MLKIARRRRRPARSSTSAARRKEGDHVSASSLYAAGGTTRDVTLRFIVRWLDAAGASPRLALSPRPANYHRHRLGAAADPRATARRRPAPPTSGSRCDRVAGGSGDAYVTGIEARKGDPAALARHRHRPRRVAAERLRRDHLAHDHDQRHLRHRRRPSSRETSGARSPRSTALAATWVLPAEGRRRGRHRRGGRLHRRRPARRSPPSRSTTTTSTSRAGSAPATW